jgi:hypothetical protein
MLSHACTGIEEEGSEGDAPINHAREDITVRSACGAADTVFKGNGAAREATKEMLGSIAEEAERVRVGVREATEEFDEWGRGSAAGIAQHVKAGVRRAQQASDICQGVCWDVWDCTGAHAFLISPFQSVQGID